MIWHWNHSSYLAVWMFCHFCPFFQGASLKPRPSRPCHGIMLSADQSGDTGGIFGPTVGSRVWCAQNVFASISCAHRKYSFNVSDVCSLISIFSPLVVKHFGQHAFDICREWFPQSLLWTRGWCPLAREGRGRRGPGRCDMLRHAATCCDTGFCGASARAWRQEDYETGFSGCELGGTKCWKLHTALRSFNKTSLHLLSKMRYLLVRTDGCGPKPTTSKVW